LIRICVDTFHHPYVELDRQLHFPEVNLERGHGLPVSELLNALRQSGLDWFQLPVRQDLPLSRSHPDCLHLARLIPAGHGLAVLFVLRLRAAFLGGDAGSGARKQGISPAFHSSRIYYHSFLLPATASSSDVELIRYAPSMGVSVQKEAATGWFRPTALFDSPDYSQLDRELSNRYAFGQDASFLQLLNPFQIQYGTMALCLLAPIPRLLDDLIDPYIDLVRTTLDAEYYVSPSTEKYWKDFYASFHFARFLSPSGNPHWEFTRFPGSDLLEM
jgi:hypothetical protein